MIANYLELIEAFVSGGIDANCFEGSYLELFGNDQSLSAASVEFKILDKLFADCDAYCRPDFVEDPRFDIGEAELKKSAEEALIKLKEIIV
jgi:hypothetical protein